MERGRRIFGIMGKRASKLTKDEIRELEESTYFDAKQLRKWHQEFLKDCPSGFMTKSEFRKIYGQFFPCGDPTKFVDYIFNVFDEDKNGVITFKEFIRAISITTKGNIDEKLNWAFNLYDLDNDGFVTRSEMLDIVTAIYVLHGKAGPADSEAAGADNPRKRVDQLFAKLDTDADARISREEFCEGFKTDPWIRRALLNAVSMPDQPKSLRSFSTASSE
ncbi:frequenin-1-like isoform X2 [Dermacentor silvarum]|uniref:frequenin-1-like isoform X1 n=1 Tax=Dermacentor silvarum TaxID=543639 RepID=UPI00210102BB|nr:frequenin-1-like isoform X1 [Dermacentor silvarum]XP_049516741.1 frequenin-1-like isoform X2 [Dermacentor silvarum]